MSVRIGDYRVSFGDDSGYAAQDVSAFMDQEVAALRQAWQAGLSTIQKNDSGFVADVTNWLSGTGDVENAVAANYAAIKQQIDQLDGPIRQRVLGGDLALDGWISDAQSLQDDITSQTDYSWDAAGLSVIEQTAHKTAADATNPFAWPWYFWVAGAAGAAYLARPIFSFLAAREKNKRAEHVNV